MISVVQRQPPDLFTSTKHLKGKAGIIVKLWCSAGYTQVYGIYLLIFQSTLRMPTFSSALKAEFFLGGGRYE